MNKTYTLPENFDTVYFSGAQARIYIGDVYVDEAIEVDGTYSVEKIPIYGYASHHWNTIATGRVIVSGTLSINYKYDGYLWACLKALQNSKQGLSGVIDEMKTKGKLQSFTPIEALDAGPQTNKQINKALENKKKVYSTGYFTDENILKHKKQYWDDYKNESPSLIRPEFMHLFNIEIRDCKMDNDTYNRKTLINCALNQHSTVRRADGTPLVEMYAFVAQSFI